MYRALCVFAALAAFTLTATGSAYAAEVDPRLHIDCASFTSPTVTVTAGGGVSIGGDSVSLTPVACVPSLVPIVAR